MAEPLTDGAWAAFEDKLRSYVGRRVEGPAADDVLGDILEKLVRSKDKVAAAETPMAWVYRVAANAVTDHYRRRAAERRLLDAAQAETGLMTPEAGGRNEAAALADCLVPMIEALPAPYGEALMMTDIGGMSQTAAAERLGLSPSGMKSRVQRGRRKLKESLLRCCRVSLNRRGDVLNVEPREDGCGGCRGDEP